MKHTLDEEENDEKRIESLTDYLKVNTKKLKRDNENDEKQEAIKKIPKKDLRFIVGQSFIS